MSDETERKLRELQLALDEIKHQLIQLNDSFGVIEIELKELFDASVG